MSFDSPEKRVSWWLVKRFYLILCSHSLSSSPAANLLNFNVGDGLKFALPNSFWTSLQARFGNLFYVRDQGEDQVSMPSKLLLVFPRYA